MEERLTSFRVRDNSANESGDKPQTSIRSNNELPVVLKLYRDLNEKDFLQVFPQASQFVKDGQIVLDYALAQLLLSGPDQLCYKAVGYEILSQAAADQEKWFQSQSSKNELRCVVDIDGNAVGMVGPVSYTHLDVYKRQDHQWKDLSV